MDRGCTLMDVYSIGLEEVSFGLVYFVYLVYFT